MLQKLLLIGILFFSIHSFSQVDSTFVDSKYLEDQIYFGLSYNVLYNKPANFNQNGLSGGLMIGFIKDLPLNERRNQGLGVGLGYAYNAYIQNLKITNGSTASVFETTPSENFKSNRFVTHILEMPIEYRWRTSTAKEYRFWRIYTGVKFGYVWASNSKMTGTTEGDIKVKNIKEIDKLQYGLILSAGHGTLNFNLYYGLNSLFKNAEVNGKKLNLKQINFGLIFYIM